MLGVYTLPTSDLHDGTFTGIRIDDFKEHENEAYLTFDVTFCEDTAPPRVTTEEMELALEAKVKLEFHDLYTMPGM